MSYDEEERMEEQIVGCWIDQYGSVSNNLKILHIIFLLLLSLIWEEKKKILYKNWNAKELW